MRWIFLITAFFGLASCQGDETVRKYGASDKTWILKSINDIPFKARATLRFPEEGGIAGEAPCNTYFASMNAPYPWFETGPIGATRMACPDLDKENEYLTMLAKATKVEVLGDTLILSDDDKLSMVFKAAK